MFVFSDSQKRSGSVSPKGVKRSHDNLSVGSTESSSDSDGPRLKSPRTSEIHKCPSCSYVTDKLVNLQRHKATHASDGESSADAERMSVSPVCQDEMYCKECKIQFSSMSTFKGHKEFYCRYRQVGSKEGENLSELASAGGQVSGSDLTLKMLKSSALSLESQLLAAKGHIHPALLANPALLQSPLFLQEFFAKSQQGEIAKALSQSQFAAASVLPSGKKSMESEEQPLDLSKSNKSSSREGSPGEDNTEIKVKREPVSSPDCVSPSAKKQKLGEEQSSSETGPGLPKTPLNIPSIHPSILMPGQVQYVNKKPIPPLQSVSRCVECNIVFYKHENFLIHKEHYCSGRRSNKDSSSDTENLDSDQKDTEQSSAQSSCAETPINPKKDNNKKGSPEPKVESEPGSSEISLKHYCIPCKIRYSSSGTLKAHKEYYCPYGKIAAGKDADKDSESSNSDQMDGSTYRCENCKNDFSSARHLKLHMCMGNISPTPLLRCMYCDYVTQTENRMSEHMKCHVPTKAFKCNLCGYRGNTARGMRMHGKMHLENGEEFTDDNMIEYEEPPSIPVQRNGVCEKGPVDMEAELIRMKNEPYKRRRSRKSFEKSENMVPFLGQNMLTQICAACGQTFTNLNDFVLHLRMHEIAALEAMKSLKSLSCEHCSDYVADSLTSLLIHMQTKHPEQLPGTSKNDTDRASESEKSNEGHENSERSRSSSVESSKTNLSSSSQDSKSLNCRKKDQTSKISNGDSTALGCVEVKVEKEIVNEESNSEKSPGNHDLPATGQSQYLTNAIYNKLEDTRSEKTDRKRHSPETSSKPASSPQQQISKPVKLEPKSPSSSPDNIRHSKSFRDSSTSPTESGKKYDAKMSPKLTSPDPKTRYLLNIKQEQMSPPLVTKSPVPSSPKTPYVPKSPVPLSSHSPKLQNIPFLYNPLLAPYQFGAGLPMSLLNGARIQVSPPGPASPVEKMAGRKFYCKHCDINFTYLSSFLTHKKNYCSARNTAEDAESPTATA